MNEVLLVIIEAITIMARWLSWLERRPVTAEVVGSNPIRVVYPQGYILISEYGILAQLGEHLPYKQRVIGSSPIGPIYADVAQLAEQLICNQQVIGSSPIIGFIQFNIELYYGQIPEWPKGTDCKSAATCFDGSNPSLPITLYRVTKYYRGMEQSGSSPGS